MTNEIISEINKIENVGYINEWNGRHYINFSSTKTSSANADKRSKLWLKGSILTVEIGKGYMSDEYYKGIKNVAAKVIEMGGKVVDPAGYAS